MSDPKVRPEHFPVGSAESGPPTAAPGSGHAVSTAIFLEVVDSHHQHSTIGAEKRLVSTVCVRTTRNELYPAFRPP
jgi:hypothetical protein